MTDDQRLANLEQMVESHDRHIADLCRSIEALHALLDAARLEQIRAMVRSGITPLAASEPEPLGPSAPAFGSF